MWLPLPRTNNTACMPLINWYKKSLSLRGKFLESGNLDVMWPCHIVLSCKSAVKTMFISLLSAIGKTSPPTKRGVPWERKFEHIVTGYPSVHLLQTFVDCALACFKMLCFSLNIRSIKCAECHLYWFWMKMFSPYLSYRYWSVCQS